ncbi:SDR family oxidoreductase [Leifsonia sp. AG29]|uniref:SDR family oxidoreductase n=1 Tax=Leifsonia sp. AG29 TaxID=2598860 RepID=UPI00131E4D6E|nr:SDR family oxidoreductase [Leifsonia sp. AG29]
MNSRVAVVTGASSGIGRATALRLADDGFDIVAQYNGNQSAADAVVAQAQAAGRRAVAVRADIGDEGAVADLFAAAETLGGVDVVVNAAGIMPLAPVADTDMDTFDQVTRTNIRGSFLVARQAARAVRAGGAVILFSTSVTRTQSPTYAAYVMSKSAVEGLPLILARELAGRDVTVNVVAPGPTDTPLFRNGKSPEVIDRIAGLVPSRRLGTPEDIAEVVAALAGPARWINGQVLYVNGGLA